MRTVARTVECVRAWSPAERSAWAMTGLCALRSPLGPVVEHILRSVGYEAGCLGDLTPGPLEVASHCERDAGVVWSVRAVPVRLIRDPHEFRASVILGESSSAHAMLFNACVVAGTG